VIKISKDLFNNSPIVNIPLPQEGEGIYPLDASSVALEPGYWYNLSGIFTVNNEGLLEVEFKMECDSAEDSLGKKIEITELILVNLTESNINLHAGQCEEAFPDFVASRIAGFGIQPFGVSEFGGK